MTPPELAVAEPAAPATAPAAPHRPLGRLGNLRKYLKIVRVSLVERMTYRADFILGTLLRFLPMLTTILLWQAIYTGSGQSSLSGYDLDDMISYLLLVHISRMFSSMPGLASGISRHVREGTLKQYLL